MPDTQTYVHKKLLGSIGEKKAARFLKKKGFKIIEKNYVCPFGEIDLIGLYADFLVFIEVKSRADNSFGEASEAVDEFKQQRYRKSATMYLMSHKDLTLQPRFDVVEVYPYAINHIEDAF